MEQVAMIETKGQGKFSLEIGCKLTISGTSPQSHQILMMARQCFKATWGSRPTAVSTSGKSSSQKFQQILEIIQILSEL